MSTREIIRTNKTHVSCSGQEMPFDHPVIYLEIDTKEGEITCPYCSKQFVLNVKA